MNEIIIPIVSGVISAIIGSIVTALVSWRIQIRKEKREDLINQKKDQQDIYNKRPEFNIVEFKNYLDRKDGYGLRQKCDINIFLTLIYGAKITKKIVYANYKAEDFNKKNWCCVIYKLKNVGKTTIKSVDIVSNFKQRIALFDTKSTMDFLKEGCLNYSESLDQIIRTNDEITLKVCFNKERIFNEPLNPILSLGFIDENNNYWMQPLYISGKISICDRVKEKEYYKIIRKEDAEECFRKPYLW